jgi:hypothetical protein
MTLYYLRVLCLVLWLVAAVILVPGLMRYVRGPARPCDEYQTAFFFTALLFIGSLGRWLVIPYDTQVFVALYALTAALAAYVLILARQGWGK